MMSVNNVAAQGVSTIPVSLINEFSGLENLNNYNCFKDSHGFVWISSFAGLYRYDGSKMKLYLPRDDDSTSLGGKYVHSRFVEDHKGNLWFGTFRNIMCYLRDQDHFVSYQMPGTSRKANYYICGIDSLSQLWFKRDTAIYIFDLNTRKINWKASVLSNSWRTVLHLDKDGVVKHTYTYSNEANKPGVTIHKFEQSQLKGHWTILNNHPKRVRVRDIHCVSDTVVLIASTKGLFHYNPLNGKLDEAIPTDLNPGWNCESITNWGDSLFFLGSYSNGFYLYNAEKRKFIKKYRIIFQGKVINESTTGMDTDSDGGIWIFLHNKGVAYFHPDNLIFDHYMSEILVKGKSIPFKVGSLVEHGPGKVLVSSETIGGYFIDEIDGNISGPSEKCKSCPMRVTRSFRSSDGTVWMSDRLRLYRMVGDDKVSVIEPPEGVGSHWYFTDHREHSLTTLSDGTIMQLNNTNSTDFHVLDLPDSYHYNFIAAHSNGYVYIGSDLKYLHQFDLENNNRIIKSIPFPYMINCLEPVDGTDDFIIGSNRGAYYWDAKTELLTLIDYCDCGYDKMVFSVIHVGETQYLMSTDNGVCLVDISTKESLYFSSEHGLVSVIFNRFGYMKHSSGKIWLGSNHGIVVTDPDRLVLPELDAMVNITEIKINDRSRAYEEDNNLQLRSDSELSNFSLSHTANTLTFEFSALSYAGIGGHDYQYRMLGIESEWVDCGTVGFARYPNLPAEDLIFEVRVKDKSETLRQVAFSIAPPFYAKSWFIVVIVLLTISAIYFASRLVERRKQRIRQLHIEKELAVQNERLRISNNIHDDLGSGLSALTLKTRILRDRMTGTEYKSQMDRIVDFAEDLASRARESIWMTNAKNDTLENLLIQLHEYTSEFLAPSAHLFSVKLPSAIPSMQVSGDHRRQIYLAFKEGLHNAYKHGKASRIDVALILSQGLLRIRITDDGKGFFVNDDNGNGNGIESMKQRMEKVGGTFSIDSSGSGTCLELIYPLNSVL